MNILLVEDDHFYAYMLTEDLLDHGFSVDVASSVQDALTNDISRYVACVIDVMLPNDPEASGITEMESRGGLLSGVALARRLKQRYPGLRMILLSAALAGNESELWASQQKIPFIHKSEQASGVRRALG